MPLEALQNGRYRILRALGSGSMGEVYLVEDTRINREVAIKVIRTEAVPYPDSTASQDAGRLFEREAKAIARLNHPHILPLYDFGEEVNNGTPLAYMVMPYCPAGSLTSWLQQRGSLPLSPSEAMHFLRQAADALQHAHDNGIIHQDVKPQNFLLRSTYDDTELPDLLLADFGIAKLAAGTSSASQAIRGTPIYMAPEQWEGNPVPASDQYALAVMIYQLLAGHPPFQGGPGQLMYQHFNTAPQPASTFNPAVSPEMDAVLLRALAKKPEERFPSMSAFSHAFQQALLLDTSTVSGTRSKSDTENIRATLAISPEEAHQGTSRTLTLADGQRVTVAIPPGMQNGNIIHAVGKDKNDHGIAIPLILTIAIVGTGASLPTFMVNDAPTVASGIVPSPNTPRTRMTSNPNLGALERQATISNQPTVPDQNAAPVVLPSPPTPPSNVPVYDNQMGPPPVQPLYDNAAPAAEPRRSSPALAFLVGILAVLLILGSAGLVFYYLAIDRPSNPNPPDVITTATVLASNDTATSQSNTQTAGQTNASATAQAQFNAHATATANTQNQSNANSTATANAQNNANATATGNAQNSANATATANAQGNATATAQANTNATATAQANATATAIAAHPVVSNGTGTLQGTYSFDFDQGLQTNTGADVFWDQHTNTVRTMDPINGAQIVNIGVTNFDAITFAQLQSASYSTTPIDGNNDSTNQLVNGDVFAVKTTDGNYAKVLIVSYGYNLQIQWVTYHG